MMRCAARVVLFASMWVGCQCADPVLPAASPRETSPPAASRTSLARPQAGDAPSSSADAADSATPSSPKSLRRAMAALVGLHQTLKPPRPGEWLAEHAEPGQTFAAYLQVDPVVPDREAGPGKRHALDVQPLGPLSGGQRRVVELTRDYLERYFGMPVRLLPTLPLSLIPKRARRIHPSWGVPQILSTHVLDELLVPRLADDAAAIICFTASDLWPGAGWNFVFGQASLSERVGVWSVHRHGDPDVSKGAFRLALLRALKVAVHETGHMLSIRHCTAYRCVMGGSNSLDESDGSPLWLCPECLAKISWATGVAPAVRYRKLLSLVVAQGLEDEADFFRRSLEALAQAGAL